MLNNKNTYTADTDGRIYILSYDDLFVNFDERDLSEIVEVLFYRRKKLALKLISIIDDVGVKKGLPNLFLEEIKSKCLK